MNTEWAKFIESQILVYSANQLGRKAKDHEFAAYLGVDPAYISHWKKGYRVPNGPALDAVAAKLGIEAYTAAGTSARLPQNPFLWAIAKTLPILPEELQAFFANQIEAASKKSMETGKPATQEGFRATTG
jgi:transcriptional regulator with XRE-family HTH domain